MLDEFVYTTYRISGATRWDYRYEFLNDGDGYLVNVEAVTTMGDYEPMVHKKQLSLGAAYLDAVKALIYAMEDEDGGTVHHTRLKGEEVS